MLKKYVGKLGIYLLFAKTNLEPQISKNVPKVSAFRFSSVWTLGVTMSGCVFKRAVPSCDTSVFHEIFDDLGRFFLLDLWHHSPIFCTLVANGCNSLLFFTKRSKAFMLTKGKICLDKYSGNSFVEDSFQFNWSNVKQKDKG